MAVNPVQFLVASNASILDGTKTITISGGVNASRVFSGTAVFLGGADNPAEAVSGTAPDGSGISTITLRNNWTQGDVSNQSLVAFNTNEGLAEAISNVREIVSNASALEDLATEGLVKRIDDNNYEVVSITSLGESLVGANDSGTARSVLALGSAATKDVGTSDGNVMKVGAFGLGATTTPQKVSDFDSASTAAGFYLIASDVPNISSRPSGFSAFGVLQVMRFTTAEITQVYIDVNGNSANRKFFDSTGWSDWAITYHSGNSVNPLDYGLGQVFSDIGFEGTLSNSRSFADLETKTRFFGWSTTGNAPSDSFNTTTPLASAGVRMCSSTQRYADFLITTQGAQSNTSAWFKAYDGDNDSGWKEFYHSDNSVNPLDYGIGRQGGIVAGDNANLLVEGGIYRVTSTMQNTAIAGTSCIIVSRSFNVVGQIQTDGNNTWTRRSTDTGATWQPWRELYHSGNSVNPLDYNLGNTLSNNTQTDINDAFDSGTRFDRISKTTANRPELGSNVFGGVLTFDYQNYNPQFFFGSSSTGVPAAALRVDNQGTPSDWHSFYHSGNTNFNEFGRSASSDVIGVGVAEAGNIAKFILPLNYITSPSSITVQGEFDIYGAGGSDLRVEGVTSLNLNGKSSNKCALIYYNDPSNIFTVGEYLELRTKSNSKITVNP